jgi:hypothetical protein
MRLLRKAVDRFIKKVSIRGKLTQGCGTSVEVKTVSEVVEGSSVGHVLMLMLHIHGCCTGFEQILHNGPLNLLISV